jgi:hypothetical protein
MIHIRRLPVGLSSTSRGATLARTAEKCTKPFTTFLTLCFVQLVLSTLLSVMLGKLVIVPAMAAFRWRPQLRLSDACRDYNPRTGGLQ